MANKPGGMAGMIAYQQPAPRGLGKAWEAAARAMPDPGRAVAVRPIPSDTPMKRLP